MSADPLSALSDKEGSLSSGNMTLNMRVIKTVSRVACKPDSGIEPSLALPYVCARVNWSRLRCSAGPGASVDLVEVGPAAGAEILEEFADMTCIFVLEPVLTVLLEPNMQLRTVFVASLKSSSRPSSPPGAPETVDDRVRDWKVPTELLRGGSWPNFGLNGLLGD